MSFTLSPGSQPLLVSMPHVGTDVPADLREGYTPRALGLEDTDWHLPRLYSGLNALGASVLVARYSRYIIDLNRPPDDTPMYHGAHNTELCPTRFFTGEPLYHEGHAPSPEERLRRRARYWQPYHDALADELARLTAEHGFALLWDAHSIRSQIPWLFEGVLPDLNIGTADGVSAHGTIARAMDDAAARHGGMSRVINGRFKGGFITRHYGRPERDIHAVQLEMCQRLYMQEVPPYDYDDALAAGVQPLLADMTATALSAAKALYGK